MGNLSFLETRELVLPASKSVRFELFNKQMFSFSIEKQEQENWCWASVAKAVRDWFGNSDPLSQCEIASLFLDQDCCGDMAKTEVCDRQIALEEVLQRFGMLDKSRGPQTFKKAKRHFKRSGGAPICLRIQWRQSAREGHFLLATGATKSVNGRFITVSDPANGSSKRVQYDTLLSNYKGAGSWSDTYFVKSQKSSAEAMA